jgi:MFS family permease
LADRRGPRTLFVLLSLLVAGLSLLYLLVGTFWQFLAVAVVLTVIGSANASKSDQGLGEWLPINKRRSAAPTFCATCRWGPSTTWRSPRRSAAREDHCT